MEMIASLVLLLLGCLPCALSQCCMPGKMNGTLVTKHAGSEQTFVLDLETRKLLFPGTGSFYGPVWELVDFNDRRWYTRHTQTLCRFYEISFDMKRCIPNAAVGVKNDPDTDNVHYTWKEMENGHDRKVEVVVSKDGCIPSRYAIYRTDAASNDKVKVWSLEFDMVNHVAVDTSKVNMDEQAFNKLCRKT